MPTRAYGRSRGRCATRKVARHVSVRRPRSGGRATVCSAGRVAPRARRSAGRWSGRRGGRSYHLGRAARRTERGTPDRFSTRRAKPVRCHEPLGLGSRSRTQCLRTRGTMRPRFGREQAGRPPDPRDPVRRAACPRRPHVAGSDRHDCVVVSPPQERQGFPSHRATGLRTFSQIDVSPRSRAGRLIGMNFDLHRLRVARAQGRDPTWSRT